MKLSAKLLAAAQLAVSKNAADKHCKNPAEILPDVKKDISSKIGESFIFGFSKEEIIPPVKIPSKKKKYYIAGYRNNNAAVGVLDYMNAKALWIDDNTGRGGVVFVSVDCVGLFGADVAIIRDKLNHFSAITGCRSINICSTHCHAGIDTMGMWGPLPKTGRDNTFMQLLYEKIVSAVEGAYKNRTSGDIFYSSVKADKDSQSAPRPPHVYNDTVTRIRFSPANSEPDIYLINFGAHPESLLGKNSLLSADFPCYTARYIKEMTGCETIFFAGAVGGITMRPMDENNIISTIKTGERLGEIALSAINEIKLEPVINIKRKEIYISSDNPVFWFISKFGIIPEKMVTTGEGKLNLGMKTEISLISMGNINLLLLPCEIFPELVWGGYLSKEESSLNEPPEINPEPLCKTVNDDNLIVMGLANGEIGYVLAPNDYLLDSELPFINEPTDKFGRRHYPETNSLGPDTAYAIASAVKDIVNS